MAIPTPLWRFAFLCAAVWPVVFPAADQTNSSPQDLADRFELPPGFHVYRAAGPELSGGSYALTFDGEGRLLVGDGNAVRRLSDKDGDGVFDSYEVIATGLGWRGPQGLLVHGDLLYAVGGDGIQVFEGYRSGKELIHKGRIGNKFNTGGDHDAHTIFRGPDGYLYFMAGNGAGIGDRKHITEDSSPVMLEREASVFRISPDGEKWECIATGGRNPPNLGMNSFGDLFSFDSDMEWHVGLPWYRPVRLNHWAVGGDQGWQEVGAYPPYYIDCLPGILNVGRGSPTWGIFYEHNQFPEKYRDAYIVCDYRWKKESNDQYATTGRLVAFFLKRDGAGWKATMETLAKPKPGALDANGGLINFALVDVAVAPDGSLFLTDHNQGIWRLHYRDPARDAAGLRSAPPILLEQPSLPTKPARILDEALSQPQPLSEWSRLRLEQIRGAFGGGFWRALRRTAADSRLPLSRRLRAVFILASRFEQMPYDFLNLLSRDGAPEIRGQAAWLAGLRHKEGEVSLLLNLLADRDPFVRRRAAESLTRFHSAKPVPALIERLGDPERLVRYEAMTALAHHPTTEWFEAAAAKANPQIRMRALVASLIRREPPADEVVRHVVQLLLENKTLQGGPSADRRSLPTENRLDLLRILALFRNELEGDAASRSKIAERLLQDFPDADVDIRWEQIRLLGEYQISQSIPRLLALLETERDEVAQFHIAQAASKLPGGWKPDEEGRLLRWMLGTQRGWFAQFDGKGVEFPLFLQTVLADFARNHANVLLNAATQVELGSLLGSVMIDLIARSPKPEEKLLDLYRGTDKTEARTKIVAALKIAPDKSVDAFLRGEYERSTEPRLRAAIVRSLASRPVEASNLPLMLQGLRHEETEVVRACAEALIQFKPGLDEPLANVLVSRLAERRSLYYAMDAALSTLSGQTRPGFKPGPEPGERLEESTRTATVDFWTRWYEQRFKKRFQAAASASAKEQSDEEVRSFIMSAESNGGRAVRGARVYEQLQCNTCHGGGVTPGREGRLFGPDLSGVTTRLTRAELADAIVYPSKQVADRFKAVEIELKDSAPLTGFVTEQNDDFVMLADREQIHRLPRVRIRSITPQSASLMPEHLLNALNRDDIRDLLAFLEGGSGATK